MNAPTAAPALQVTCPVCDAHPGERCTQLSALKTQTGFTHFVRRQIAARRPTTTKDS